MFGNGNEITFKIYTDIDIEDIPPIRSIIKFLTELIEATEKKEQEKIDKREQAKKEKKTKAKSKSTKKVSIVDNDDDELIEE
jgi:hypothetical protein